MVFDDLYELGKDQRERGAILRHLEISIQRMKEPERRISGMIEALVLPSGNRFGIRPSRM